MGMVVSAAISGIPFIETIESATESGKKTIPSKAAQAIQDSKSTKSGPKRHTKDLLDTGKPAAAKKDPGSASAKEKPEKQSFKKSDPEKQILKKPEPAAAVSKKSVSKIGSKPAKMKVSAAAAKGKKK